MGYGFLRESNRSGPARSSTWSTITRQESSNDVKVIEPILESTLRERLYTYYRKITPPYA